MMKMHVEGIEEVRFWYSMDWHALNGDMKIWFFLRSPLKIYRLDKVLLFLTECGDYRQMMNFVRIELMEFATYWEAFLLMPE